MYLQSVTNNMPTLPLASNKATNVLDVLEIWHVKCDDIFETANT